MSAALKARQALEAKKRAWERELDEMSDDAIAVEIDHLENCDPRKGSFLAWALSCARRELDNRI